MKRHQLFFVGPGQVEVRAEPLPSVPADQVLVKSMLSAISPGTELLIYQGLFPHMLPKDDSIAGLAGRFEYPFRYGYATVGRVVECGRDVDPSWGGRDVFVFHPHEDYVLIQPDALMPLPEGMSPETAVFLPNTESAVNFIMDGRPMIGERVVVFGQGIVGLLTAHLLRAFPLDRLVTLDRYPARRQASLEIGVDAVIDPEQPDVKGALMEALGGDADLAIELSGNPRALNLGLAVCGYDGRIVIGSWYGAKRTELDLGGRFHRNRVRMFSSQVSKLAPELRGRWSKARRFSVVWKMLKQIQPTRYITHRIPFHDAGQAYRLLDRHPEQVVQVVLDYSQDGG